MTIEAIRAILAGLVARYHERTPEFDALVRALLADGIIETRDQLVVDHLAFRTFGIGGLGIVSLERLLTRHGYVRRDAYTFAEKHLDAYWYSAPAADLPRIFVSELRVTELSPLAQDLVRSCISDATACGPLDTIDLDDAAAVIAALTTPLWNRPRLRDYQSLVDQSEYAAWTLANGYEVNHVALLVHELRADMRTVAAFNAYLNSRGFTLNDAANPEKTSPDGLLIQSSIIAQTVDAYFAGDQQARIAGSYVEFVERRVLPEFAGVPAAAIRREHRRDGFEAANAERIFESTNVQRADYAERDRTARA